MEESLGFPRGKLLGVRLGLPLGKLLGGELGVENGNERGSKLGCPCRVAAQFTLGIVLGRRCTRCRAGAISMSGEVGVVGEGGGTGVMLGATSLNLAQSR